MSTNYSASQYNQEFAPKRMQMYEVPKAQLSKEPSQRKSDITFIANERGHLAPGISRSNSNPFGDYVGTWDLPKTIPGPYHLVDTGRTNKNIEILNEKKRSTEKAIVQAREDQKPYGLKSLDTNRSN